MQLREGNILNLINLYKNGDINARNKLIETNYKMIKEKAETSYKLLTIKIKEYYNIKDKNYILPDNVINIDDVIQDFYEKTIYVLEKYINEKKDEYFSTYLNQTLTTYINIYAEKMFNKIINKENNEFNIEIKNNYKESKDNKIEEIKFLFKNDSVLKKHEEFIDMILDGYTMKELKKETGLDGRRLGMKIKYLACEYNKKREVLSMLYNTVDDNIYILLKERKIYQIPYYKKIIDDAILFTINKIVNTEIADYYHYSDIFNYYIDISNSIIKNYFKNNRYDLLKFNEFFLKRLNRCKYITTINRLFNYKENRRLNEKKYRKKY